MTTLVLAEAEVELVPEEIRDHPIIRRSAAILGRDPSSILLDSNLHHGAMGVLRDRGRRGRPDILYLSLHTALSSLRNREEGVRIYVTLRDGRVFEVDSKVRLPRAYNRFCGLWVSLLKGDPNPFIRRVDGIEWEDPVYVMDRRGRPWKGGDGTFVVGMFPRGPFRFKYPGSLTSLSRLDLDAWAVVGRVLCPK